MPKPTPTALNADIIGRANLNALRASGSDASIAAWYAGSDVSGPKAGTYLTEMGVYRVLGPADGEAFLSSLETVATVNPIVKRTLAAVKNGGGVGNPDSGLDFGHPTTQAFLTSLANSIPPVITQAAKNALIVYASRPWSRAEILWGEGVVITSDDVAAALRGM